MKQHESSKPTLTDWIINTTKTAFIGATAKVLSVPPTQFLVVWMRVSQANLSLSKLEVIKLSCKTGLMKGWEVGALREGTKSMPKFIGMSFANLVTPKHLAISNDEKINTIALSMCKGTITGLIEGPFATFFNAWITYTITQEALIQDGKLPKTEAKPYFQYLKTQPKVLKQEVSLAEADIERIKTEAERLKINTKHLKIQPTVTETSSVQLALKGNVATTVRQSISNSMIIALTHLLTRPVAERFEEYNDKTKKLITGILVGICTASVLAPMETVLTDLQKAQSKNKSFFSAMSNMYSQHGIRSFTRGLPQKTGLIAAGSTFTSIVYQYITMYSASEKSGQERE